LYFRQNRRSLGSCVIVDADGNERKVPPAECVGLERSAVWSAENVESRLEDHYGGRPNGTVERMRVMLP
jgi:hypothetical protein